jgi:hypothetical protein
VSSPNGPPQLTWPNIAAGLLVATALAGAAWTLFQSQFAYVEKSVFQNRNDSIKSDDAIKHEIERINAELLARRSEFPTMELFKQLERLEDERYSDTKSRLNQLEQSRPTTGELAAVAKSNETLAAKLDERVRSLENFVRQAPKSTKEQ